MLEIRTFRSKSKGVRVDIFRKYKHVDEKTKTPKTRYKQLGSFPLEKGYEPELIELLQPDEYLQLQNWLAEANFAKKLNVPVDSLDKFFIQIPVIFYDALTRLHIEAKRIGIDFLPNKIMLESLLDTAKSVQTKLDKINGFKSRILEEIGIETNPGLKSERMGEFDKESQILFKTLLGLKQPIGNTCNELEEAAKGLGKIKKIPPPQLREWAGDMPGRNQDKKVKKWCYALAIDVLKQHGINPITLTSPDKVAEYWALQRKKKYTLKEASKHFIKDFSVPNNKKSNVLDAIDRVYKTGREAGL